MSIQSRRANRIKASDHPPKQKKPIVASRNLQDRKTARILHTHPEHHFTAVGIIYGTDTPFSNEPLIEESGEPVLDPETGKGVWVPIQFVTKWSTKTVFDATENPKNCLVCGKVFQISSVRCDSCGEFRASFIKQCSCTSFRRKSSLGNRQCTRCKKRFPLIQLTQLGYGEYCSPCLSSR